MSKPRQITRAKSPENNSELSELTPYEKATGKLLLKISDQLSDILDQLEQINSAASNCYSTLEDIEAK